MKKVSILIFKVIFMRKTFFSLEYKIVFDMFEFKPRKLLLGVLFAIFVTQILIILIFILNFQRKMFVI